MALLWLRCRLAAVALIRPLAWELPYAVGEALKKKYSNNKKLMTGVPTVAQWLRIQSQWLGLLRRCGFNAQPSTMG